MAGTRKKGEGNVRKDTRSGPLVRAGDDRRQTLHHEGRADQRRGEAVAR